jgi:anti-anti-sigma factor
VEAANDTAFMENTTMAKLTLTRQMLSEVPGVLVVRLAGTVDSDNGRSVDEYMKESFQALQPTNVLLDCSNLAYVPSAFLGSLLFWKEQISKRGGRLVLFAVQSFVADILQAVGFTRLFSLSADQDSALAALPAN